MKQPRRSAGTMQFEKGSATVPVALFGVSPNRWCGGLGYLVGMALSVGCCFLSGCVTVPQSDQATTASYVGDRTSVNFDEIVVSVKLGDVSAALQNLHVRLGAI